MEYKVNYKLINDSDSNDRDVLKLKCAINDDQKTIFEFTDELLRHENFQGLKISSTAHEFYKVIEKFLLQAIKSNDLKEIYYVRSDNYWQY